MQRRRGFDALRRSLRSPQQIGVRWRPFREDGHDVSVIAGNRADAVRAFVTSPGQPNSARIAHAADPVVRSTDVLIRTLEVGVCGTDREIVGGWFGEAPDDEPDLVLGHEFLGLVHEDAHGYARGELVTATVRRSCGQCAACDAGSPDACATGRYRERGITRLHGFASELVVERPEHLVRVPEALGNLGVLAEPASVCARALRHVAAIGGRQVWTPTRAAVIGAGAIGVLSTYFLRLAGYEVWTFARSDSTSLKARLVQVSGARYCSLADVSFDDVRSGIGGFDVVVEAAGVVEVMIEAMRLLGRNGVVCLLGIDGHRRMASFDSRLLGVDFVIENRAVFGSVNAHIDDWRDGVAQLHAVSRRWPDALLGVVGSRVPVDRFHEALRFPGVKATLVFDQH